MSKYILCKYSFIMQNTRVVMKFNYLVYDIDVHTVRQYNKLFIIILTLSILKILMKENKH